MDKFEQLQFDLDDLVSFISSKIEVDKNAICDYITCCICKIWGANEQLFHSDYAKALSCIKMEEFTPAQIITAMECCNEEGRELNAPEFVKQLCDYDIKNSTHSSLEAIDKTISLLISLSFINGDFTIAEANEVKKIADLMKDYCLSKGVVGYEFSYDVNSKITPMGNDYWSQKSSLDVQEAPIAEEQPAPVQQSNEVASVVVNNPVDAENDVDDDISVLSDFLQDLATNLIESIEPEGEQQEETVNLAKAPTVDKTLDQLLEELDNLIGLDNVKRDVHSLLNFIKVSQLREKRGMKVPDVSYHLVFTGNPGTGKTTVARLVAQLYYKMGILQQGQLVEADRSTLVAGYLGQTAIKVQKVIQSALGGVLFIDEAYSLANEENDSYGKEAIETLLKAMEDNRDKLVVIVAGYDDLMHKFIESNPGLRSRFNKFFHFNDYSGSEMQRIFKCFCESNGYTLDAQTEEILLAKFEELYNNRNEFFGNARTVRNVFENAINCQANRIAVLDNVTDEQLSTLTAEDVITALGGLQ